MRLANQGYIRRSTLVKSGESRSRTTEVLDSAASLCVYTQESKNRVPGVLRGRVGGTLEKSS